MSTTKTSTTKASTAKKTATKKKQFSITVTGDKTSNAKGEDLSIDELNALLVKGLSSKSKRKALVSFLENLSDKDDKVISEMFFDNPIYKTWNYNKFKTIKGNR